MRLFTFITLLFCSFPVFAQEPSKPELSPCGTSPAIGDWLRAYQERPEDFVMSRSSDTLLVGVQIHLLAKDNGTGRFTAERLLNAFCRLNTDFAGANVRFYFKNDWNLINNTAWHTHSEIEEGIEMMLTNNVAGALNCYFVADPAGNCGYAWQDAIVLGTNCSGPGNTTWAHEAGHHLSLPHPFLGWEGFDWDYNEPAPEEIGDRLVEKTDGSNCYISGDGFCDTRPDYLNYRWACDTNKESFTTQIDPNGEEFRSDATLIMGYSLDACASRFTEEQIAAMRANLYFEHDEYLQITEPLQGVADDAFVELVSPIDTQNAQYNNLTLTWNPVPGATLYNVEVGLAPGFSPKFYNQTLYNTTSVTITSGIPNNRILKWRVRAFSEWDVCHTNTNVQTGVFKTKNLSATNELEEFVVAELSPNPALKGLPAILSITSDEFFDAVLTVHDAAGRLCFTQDVRLSPGENRLDIATDDLSSGFYVVTLRNEKGALVKRLAVAE